MNTSSLFRMNLHRDPCCRESKARSSVLLRIIAGFTLATLVSSCATDIAHRPTLVPVTGNITVQDFAGTTIDFALNVTNPGNRSIVVQGYVYQFRIAGRTFKEDRVATRSNVPAGEPWQRTLTLPVQLGELDNFLRRHPQQEVTVPYDLTGSVHVVDRSGKHQIPFRATGEIALLRKPQFQLENLRFENRSPTDAEVRFDLVITNPNRFQSRFGSASVDLILEGQTFAQQMDVAALSLAPDESVRVPMSLHAHFAKLGPNAPFILEKKKISYTLAGRATFSTPWGEKNITFERGGIVQMTPWP